jgi:hypothetical protein
VKCGALAECRGGCSGGVSWGQAVGKPLLGFSGLGVGGLKDQVGIWEALQRRI